MVVNEEELQGKEVELDNGRFSMPRKGFGFYLTEVLRFTTLGF